MSKIALICLAFLLLAGCAMTPPIKTSNDVFMRSSIYNDPYKKTTWIRSPMFINHDPFLQGMGSYYAFLRVLVNDRYVTFYQFYISDSDENWRFFNRAYDSNGNKLDFVEIDHQIKSSQSVRMQEDFTINLSREYLDGAKNSGLNIKAVGKRGEKIFVLPGYYVEGFLKKVDEYTRK